MATSKMDKFANKISVELDQSAANALAYAGLDMGVSIYDKLAILLHEVCWDVHALFSELNLAADSAYGAITPVRPGDSEELMPAGNVSFGQFFLQGYTNGAAATGRMFDGLAKVSYTDYPGGGLLLPARPLYAGFTTSGFGAAKTIHCIINYTLFPMKDADYIELVQIYRGFTSG